MLTLGQEKKKLKVVNDQWGSPTFADNVVENTWMLFKSGEKGTYHITTKGMITWYDFATEIFDQSGIDVDVEAVPSEFFPRKAKRPFFSKLNTKKAQAVQETNIIGWREGLQQLFYSLNR
jgi:dTDP-4-dehydrorhamnose reductase